MIEGKVMEKTAQDKINEYNRIALSKKQKGNLEMHEYRYLTSSLLDVAGNCVCYTCGATMKNELPELAQLEESEGYTACNVIPVCKHCFEASRGKNLYDWFNHTFKKYDYNRLIIIKKKIELLKKFFGHKGKG